MRVAFRAVRAGDAQALEANLRPLDRDEVLAASGGEVLTQIERAIDVSAQCWTAEAPEGLLAIFGFAPLSLLSGEAAPWLLGTPLLSRHARLLTRTARAYCREALRQYPLLVNYVDARNTPSIRWLKRVGFEIHEAEPFGVAGLPFHRFEMKA